MDVLLSLPIASYFFTTGLTSWSTSLNLLFFYMTWSTLILSHSPLRVEVFGTAAIRIIFWLIPSLVFLLFDTLLPSLSVSLKYNGSIALPPRDPRALARVLGLAIFNLILTTGVEAGVSLGLTMLLGEAPFRTSTTLPLPYQMAKHIALLFTAREFLTYYIHRFVLHPPGAAAASRGGSNSSQLRSFAARRHAKYSHSRRAPPFSLLLMADHPVPQLLHRLVPQYLPALALSLAPRPVPFVGGTRVHLLTYFVFIMLASVEETLATSGYSVVPGIVMGGVARRTSTHHCCKTSSSGNFGAWGVLDWVHGTTVGGDVMADVRDEAEKHGAGDAVEAVRDGIQGAKKGARKRRGAKKQDSGSD